MAQQDGGNAFPLAAHSTQISEGIWTATPAQSGMSLRDYFAAQAIPALIAYQDRGLAQEDPLPMEPIAADAYELADAMLKEREK